MDISLGVVGKLVLLINESVLGSRGAGGDLGIVILSDLLVGLLGGLGTSALDGLGDVVGGVLRKTRVSTGSSNGVGSRYSHTLTVSIVDEKCGLFVEVWLVSCVE